MAGTADKKYDPEASRRDFLFITAGAASVVGAGVEFKTVGANILYLELGLKYLWVQVKGKKGLFHKTVGAGAPTAPTLTRPL